MNHIVFSEAERKIVILREEYYEQSLVVFCCLLADSLRKNMHD